MSIPRSAVAALGTAAAVLCLGACGSTGTASSTSASAARTTGTAASDLVAAAGSSALPLVSARPAASEAADPQEASSYPAPASTHHAAAASPAKAGELHIAPGALSEAEVKRELETMHEVQRRAQKSAVATMTPVAGGESIGGDGKIPIPADVPEVVQKVIAGANEIADYPYVFGGGHASFIDNAYDCSGSVSYALAAGGLLSAPEVSGALESWGVPGPGRYITVFANAGHTYMYVDGILYDTAGRSGVYASRWQVGATDNSGYVERHWPGL